MCRLLFLFVAIGLSFPGCSRGSGSSQSTGPPIIVTTDLDNFWYAWDRAAAATTWSDSVAVFEEFYREAGSEGLEDFFDARIEDVPTLLEEIRSAPRFYAQLRPQTERVPEFVPQIEAAFERWREIYPQADLPDVYFLIGRRNSAGTTGRDRILIGTEMYGLTPESPPEELGEWLQSVLKPIDELPGIVAHELIHTQANHGRSRTLLSSAVGEGSADFLGELISGLNINRHVHEWANPREVELWTSFQEVMGGRDNAGWLYGRRSEDEPADLGYWIGYKITEAYYERSQDKSAAVREILAIKDFPAFLAESGYDPS